jgi:tetratricopeptide (TPR) repeat protein
MAKSAARNLFNEGKKHLKADNIDKALRSFEKAFREDKSDTEIMSYYGMCKAVRGGRVGLGIELCIQAIKRDHRRGDCYLNLGKVFVAAGNIKGAVSVFRKGLSFDHKNGEIIKALTGLGYRSRPAITVIERSNPINRFFGKLMRKKEGSEQPKGT